MNFGKPQKEKSILARWSISDLLLDLFFPETTSSIWDLLCGPRVDFIFLEEIFLRVPLESSMRFQYILIPPWHP
jgi:hypothetical protein